MRGREQFRDSFPLDLTEATQDGLLVQDVVIHGRQSANGRVYSDRAMQSIAERADGARAFADHPEGVRGEVRPVGSLIGRFRRPRVVGDRIRAHLQVVDAPPWRDLLPALREDSMGVGFSIRASGHVKRIEDGPDVVEDVTELRAIELVSEPATTISLTESVRQRDRRERVRAVLAESGLDGLDGFVDWCAERPDGVQKAREAAEEFEEIVARPASGEAETRTRLRRFGPRLYERDPDDLIQRGRGHENGGPDLDSIIGDLFV